MLLEKRKIYRLPPFVNLISIIIENNNPNVAKKHAYETISLLKVGLPAALRSIVKKVVSALPSVPLRIISVSLPCASIVILPDVVVKVTAASPAVKSSAALDTVSKDKAPEPSVFKNCPEEPSAVGKVNVSDVPILPAVKPT